MPDAGAVARLAAPRLVRGETIDAAGAAPLYVRNKVASTVAERLANGGKA
jgi:tRNA threonylcarbamoyladenosine biosynthesis protein TsaB